MKVNLANVFLPLIQRISEDVREGRELTYTENAIGITSLLNCPVKSELRKQVGDIASVTSVEIEDGFLWEQQVKKALLNIFGSDIVKEELVLSYEYDGIRIEGHVDVVLIFDAYVVGLELKAPKYLLLKRIPNDNKDVVGHTLLSQGEKFVYMPDTYVLQSRIQNYLLRRTYPDKQVYTFLFVKTLLVKGGYARKFYVVYDTNDRELTEEEIRKLIKRYKDNNGPTFAYECMFCQYFDFGLCDGHIYEPPIVLSTDIDEETKDLLREYYQVREYLKRIETQLKKKVKGTIVLRDGRKIGWVKTRKRNIDIKRLIEVIGPEKSSRYLTVKPGLQSELARQYPGLVTSEEEHVIWTL